MKKNYLLMAAVATMFAACSETDFVNDVAIGENAKKAIDFATFSEKATRLTENSEESYAGSLSTHHDDYKVWAYRSTSNILEFDGTVVAASTNSYGETKYWDKEANWYEFYAAAPGDAAWTFIGNTTNKDQAYFTRNVTLAGTNFSTGASATLLTTFKGTGDKDLMIAAPCNVANASFGTVNFNFIHILSRLNIMVKKDAAAPAIELDYVKVYGLKSTGTFDESEAAVTTGSIGRWDNPALSGDVTYTSVVDHSVTVAGNYVLECLVIPQNVAYEEVKTDGSIVEAQAYIEIAYTINGEQYKAYYNLAALFGATAGQTIAFYEGWQNTLTITLSPVAIAFEANNEVWSEPAEKVIPIQ